MSARKRFLATNNLSYFPYGLCRATNAKNKTQHFGSPVNRKVDEFGQEIGQGNRKASRQSVFFLAAISRSGGPPLGQIKVRNISSTGLMAETGLPMKIGESVEIVLRGIGPVSGVVMRRTIDKLAVKFDLEIDPQLTRQKI